MRIDFGFDQAGMLEVDAVQFAQKGLRNQIAAVGGQRPGPLTVSLNRDRGGAWRAVQFKRVPKIERQAHAVKAGSEIGAGGGNASNDHGIYDFGFSIWD